MDGVKDSTNDVHSKESNLQPNRSLNKSGE